MSLRTALVVVLALVFGGSAAVGINSLRSAAPAAVAPDTVAIVVVAVDVPPFTTITSEMVKMRDCPEGFVPAGAIRKLEDVLERSTTQPLVKGEMLLDPMLAPRGAGRGMAARIPKGMRAYTIHTPTVEAGVAGFILPGNRVDVLLTMDGRGEEKGPAAGGTTVTLLQNIEVLAIEQRVVAPAESKLDPTQLKSVTLLVSPRDAAKLNLGHSKGRLHLSLRNLSDIDVGLHSPLFARQLWGDAFPPEKPEVKKAEKAPPQPLRIRTLRGSAEGEVLVYPGRR